jgi:O-antigen ligase
VKATRYLLILFTFCATVAQGLWVDAVQDEGILVIDIPLLLLYIFGRKRIKQAPVAMLPTILAVVFVAWSAIGLFFAPNQLFVKQEMLMNIRILLIFYAIITFVNTKEDLQYFFLGFAFGLFYEGLIAIHQWLRGPVGLGFLGEQQVGWQAMGTFVHPSVAGFYFSLMSVLVFRMAVYLRPKFHKFYVAAFFIGVIGLYATYNRANWLGFAGAMGIMFVLDFFRGRALTKRARGILAFIALVGLAGMLRYGTLIIERFSDAEDSMMADRSSSRKSLALDAWRIIQDHPVVGVGLNNYREYVNKETAGLKIVHCTYLLVTAELGFVGGVLFVAIILAYLWAGFWTRQSKDEFLYHVSSAALTGIIAFAIAMLPSPDYRNLYVKNHIWMVFAITLVAAKIEFYQRKLLADPRIRAQLAARKKALLERKAALNAGRLRFQ